MSLWVRDVEIGAKGVKRLADRKLRLGGVNGLENARIAWSEHRKAAREVFRQEGRDAARLGDVNHALACALYWAEGTKNRNVVQIINGDMNVLKVFLSFCRSFFNVENKDIKYSVTGYTNIKSADEMEKYWVKGLGLKGASAKKHNFDDFRYATRGVSGNRVGKLPYGMCTIKISCSTQIVQHIYGALEVYGGTMIDPKR